MPAQRTIRTIGCLNVRQDDQCAGPKFVAYLRVSTEGQGKSGYGLDAQRSDVQRHASAAGGVVVAEYIEVESGKRSDRPQLALALADCRRRRATLVVAKLDRLSRNVAFLANLMEAGTEFVACDNPHATRFTLHILAAVAEHEREMISKRTKDALAAARGRGVRLGNPRLQPGTRESAVAAARAKSAAADARAADLAPLVAEIQTAGITSALGIARELNARGIATATGTGAWNHRTVTRLLNRLP